MQNVVERVLNLLIYLLESPRPVTADDVRRTVPGYADGSDEAFHRMFERDKDVLRRLGVPLKMEALDAWEIDYGYTVDPDEYAVPDPGLDESERMALSVAARMVRLGGGEAGTGALLKLGGLAGGTGLEPITADLGDGAEELGVLFGAIVDRRRVSLRYRGHDRHVEPYGIAHRRGHWYLIGGTTEGQRMYRVDRIEDLEVVSDPDAFSKPAGFDIRKAVVSQPWEAGPGPGTIAKVRFDEDVAWYAARSLGLDARDEPLETEVEVANFDAFVGWVLSFGASAEVLSPPELREAVLDRVERAVSVLP